MGRRNSGDRLGIGLSVLCMIHCIGLPLLVLGIPWFEGVFNERATHLVLGVIVCAVAIRVFVRGYRLHQKRWIVATAGMGLMFLLFGIFYHDVQVLGVVSGGVVFSILGSAALVYAHYHNLCYCRESEHCACCHAPSEAPGAV